jgi:hypothetical protein
MTAAFPYNPVGGNIDQKILGIDAKSITKFGGTSIGIHGAAG